MTSIQDINKLIKLLQVCCSFYNGVTICALPFTHSLCIYGPTQSCREVIKRAVELLTIRTIVINVDENVRTDTQDSPAAWCKQSINTLLDFECSTFDDRSTFYWPSIVYPTN